MYPNGVRFIQPPMQMQQTSHPPIRIIPAQTRRSAPYPQMMQPSQPPVQQVMEEKMIVRNGQAPMSSQPSPMPMTMPPQPTSSPRQIIIAPTVMPTSSSSGEEGGGNSRELARLSMLVKQVPVERFDLETQKKLARLIKKVGFYINALSGIATSVDQYATERVLSQPGAMTLFSDIMSDYQVWCRTKNKKMEPVSEAKFKALVESRGWKRSSSKGRTVYVDIIVPSVVGSEQ